MALKVLFAALLIGANAPAQTGAREEIQKLLSEARKEAALADVAHRNRAIAILDRAIALADQEQGPAFKEGASILYERALMSLYTGDLTRGDSFAGRAAAYYEKLSGPETADLARSLNLWGIISRERADYDRAVAHLNRAIVIREKVLPADDPNTASSLLNLASVYKIRGDYARSEPLYKRGIAILEKRPQANQSMIAAALNNLANLMQATGRYKEAEQLHLQILARREKQSPAAESDIAQSLTNLAVTYHVMGEDAKAKQYAGRALAIRERIQGKDHPEVALCLHNLAAAHEALGEDEAAIRAEERALAIREAKLGVSHPYVADSLQTLAMLHARRPSKEKAIQMMARSTQIRENALALMLSSGLEEEQRSYFATLRDSTDAALTLHSRYAPRDDNAAWLAMDVILQRKGRLLDARVDQVAAVRERMQPADRPILDELLKIRSRRATLTLSGPGRRDPGEHQSEISAILAREEQLEAQLVSRNAGFQPSTKPVLARDVQKALPPGTALIEIVRFQRHEIRAVERESAGLKPRYHAYVLRPAGPPSWVDLGDAEAVGNLINEWRSELQAKRSHQAGRSASRLHDQLIGPLFPLIQDATELYLSPDDVLSLIPFAALADNRKRLLLDRFTITYLPSGRDLLRQVAPRGEEGPMIFANPDFGDRPLGTQESTSLPFFATALPGTAREARALSALMPSAKVLSGDQATEQALRAVRGPVVLHIATHGFFLDSAPERGGDERAIVFRQKSAQYDPLVQSGVLLANANRSRRSTEARSGIDDGIVTALEMAGLDLRGTQLVVLSACETGIGKVVAGDGVYGFRRALAIAGAASQLISLWKVQDEATTALMSEYYKALLGGKGRSEALRVAQQNLRRRAQYAHPYYWSGFILSGASSPLSLDPAKK